MSTMSTYVDNGILYQIYFCKFNKNKKFRWPGTRMCDDEEIFESGIHVSRRFSRHPVGVTRGYVIIYHITARLSMAPMSTSHVTDGRLGFC